MAGCVVCRSVGVRDRRDDRSCREDSFSSHLACWLHRATRCRRCWPRRRPSHPNASLPQQQPWSCQVRSRVAGAWRLRGCASGVAAARRWFGHPPDRGARIEERSADCSWRMHSITLVLRTALKRCTSAASPMQQAWLDHWLLSFLHCVITLCSLLHRSTLPKVQMLHRSSPEPCGLYRASSGWLPSSAVRLAGSS